MGTDNPRTKEERLARIRRNQQICRERKRKRVQELEQKVEELQHERQLQSAPGSDDLIELSRRVDDLTQENARLLQLLQGISSLAGSATQSPEHVQEQHTSILPLQTQPVAASLQTADMNSSLSPGSINLRPESPSYGFSLDMLSSASFPDFADNQLALDNWSWGVESINTPASGENSSFSHMPSSLVPLLDDVSAQNALSQERSSRIETEPDALPSLRYETEDHPDEVQTKSSSTASCLKCDDLPASTSEATTLCSVAFQMVFEHNRKRLSKAELDQRLRCGFRQATEPSQGCRVESRVLFNVLAEICA